MDGTEYVVEWTFSDAREAIEAWWREIPKGFAVIEGPSVSLVPSIPGIGKPGYRVVGKYVTGGHV